jgi:hypothetical protein
MGRHSKTPLMVTRTEEYLALHRSDPAKYPATIRAVAAFVPCSHSLFSKTDTIIQALVQAIDAAALAAARHPSFALTSPAPEELTVSDAALQLDLEQTIKRSMHAMAKYLGRRKQDDGAATAALAKYDLDEAMISLRREQDRLERLVAESDRRARSCIRSTESRASDEMQGVLAV